MKKLFSAFMLLCTVSTSAWSQQASVFRDLEAMQPTVLSKEEPRQLLPGAKMNRVSARGNAHSWTNEPGGDFIIRSDNSATSGGGRSSTAPGKWQVSDDGRYCVPTEWKGAETEEWCRFIVRTTDGYYAVKSTKVGTEKVYKLDIRGR